jgi:hypothetical protein
MSELLAVLQHRTFARATAATVSSYPPERRLDAGQLSAYLDRRAAGSVRERNLRDTPWLTMVVAEGDHGEHIAVLIEGSAEVVEPSLVPADVRAAAPGAWVGAWIRLTAERLMSYAAEGTMT